VQVYWEAVPKTWPGGSKASVAKVESCTVMFLEWHFLFASSDTFAVGCIV